MKNIFVGLGLFALMLVSVQASDCRPAPPDVAELVEILAPTTIPSEALLRSSIHVTSQLNFRRLGADCLAKRWKASLP